MHGILVVDDQSVVRQGLIKMIEDMQVEFGTIYEARDGEEALTVAREQKPDIILVDIMMPGLNGIQLIEKLKEEKIKTHVVIITAYSDFEFTKKAISNKVDAYILKPVIQNELFTVLMSIKEDIEKDIKYLKVAKDKEHQYYQMMLYKYLIGDDVLINVDRIFKNIYKAQCINPYYKIAIIYFSREITEEYFQVKQIIDKEIRKYGYAFVSFGIAYNKLIYILNIQDSNNTNCDCIIKSCLDLVDTSVSCGISGILEGLHSLKELYHQADIAQKESMFKGIKVYNFADIRNNEQLLIKINELDQILEYLSKGMKDELNNMINLVFSKVSTEGFSVSDIQITLFSLINYLYLHLKDDYPGIYDIDSLKENMDNCINTFRTKVLIKEIVDGMYNYVQEYRKKNSSNYAIQYIKNYVKSNFYKDVSLAKVSNELSMNYYYISDLFKKETGMSFSDYVIDIRLEKAKKLLLETGIKIYEIAEKSGFYDSKHFCRTFKKLYNLTPSEYREKYR
ncbi:MAG TPA: response regulator [Clostridiales bacterium]|nr:response regulator [Clostridiales bacterium]